MERLQAWIPGQARDDDGGEATAEPPNKILIPAPSHAPIIPAAIRLRGTGDRRDRSRTDGAGLRRGLFRRDRRPGRLAAPPAPRVLRRERGSDRMGALKRRPRAGSRSNHGSGLGRAGLIPPSPPLGAGARLAWIGFGRSAPRSSGAAKSKKPRGALEASRITPLSEGLPPAHRRPDWRWRTERRPRRRGPEKRDD